MKRAAYIGLFTATLLSLSVTAASAAETGTALKAETIRAEPFRDARSVGALAAGDKLEILKKEGGWLQVKSAKGKGWVRLLNVRTGTAPKAAQRDASGLLGMASGRAGTGKVVATTGVRGLNEEELKAAQYSASELALADTYAVNAGDAKKFAAKGKLSARKMDYLPDPAAKGGQQ